jgi:hypothetical protein
MTLNSFTRRLLLGGVAVAAVTGALALSARPSAGHPAPQGGAVIQIRDFEKAAIIEILAWSPTQPQFGIRTWVRRTGAADRYHYFWVNSEYPAIRDAASAQAQNRPLPVTSMKDDQSCVGSKCSPPSVVRGRVTDDALRKMSGDVEVKFITSSSAEIAFNARRSMLDAYLAAVDSVVGALKK